MAAWKNKFKLKKSDDKGSALVFVIIAIAFVGALVAMLVYLVYFNYLMKYTDRAAKDNFYTVESALDEIKAGVEKDVSEAMVESYYVVASNYAEDTSSNKQAYFEMEYRDFIETKLGFTDISVNNSTGKVTTYDPTLISDYWLETPKAASVGAEGARVETKDASQFNLTDEAGVSTFYEMGPYVEFQEGNVTVLKNVTISYTDADGYVAYITTDIAIETPELSFASVLTVPEIENYSIIAGEYLTTGIRKSDDTTMTAATTSITGNVYGGAKGIYVNNDGQFAFVKDDADADTVAYDLTSGSVNALNGYRNSTNPPSKASVYIDDSHNLWTEDINVESAYVNFESDCYVQDDLTVDGKYSKVTLSGVYNGYGAEGESAENSSAILINGAFTTIDFSSLQDLNLAGHAYVGSIHYNANETTDDYIAGDIDEYNKMIEDQIAEGTRDEEEIGRNGSDILMGQSFGVKSDQLMYMVPVECMGYDGDVQILAKNPMTMSEYNVLAGTYEPETDSNGNPIYDQNGNIVYSERLKYSPVKLDAIMKKVGASANSYGATYTPVFRRVDGSVLVYFYLDFPSTDKANQFFRDYYEADREAFNNYFENYVRSFRLNSALDDEGGTLSIAGNMLYMRNGNVYMYEDTFDEDLENFESMEQQRTQYESTYVGLSKYLMNSSDNLSSEQLKNTVATNLLVDDEAFDDIVPKGTYKKFSNPEGEVVAVVVNNKGYAPFNLNYSDLESDKVCLVIANGDIDVNVSEFNGLILSGGEVNVDAMNTKINYNPAAVSQAMTAKNETSGASSYAFEVIVNGIAYANTLATTDEDLLQAIENQQEDDIVRASDLVKFQNWNKK